MVSLKIHFSIFYAITSMHFFKFYNYLLEKNYQIINNWPITLWTNVYKILKIVVLKY